MVDLSSASVLSLRARIPGGLFAPSLEAGFLAAVTRSPITAFVIAMEKVSGHGMAIDLTSVIPLASGISRTFWPPLYRTMALRYLAKTGPAQPEARSAGHA